MAAAPKTLRGPSNVVARDASDYDRDKANANKLKIYERNNPPQPKRQGGGKGVKYSGPQNAMGDALSGGGDPTFMFAGIGNRGSQGSSSLSGNAGVQRDMEDAYLRALEDRGEANELGREAARYQNSMLRQQARPQSSAGAAQLVGDMGASDREAFEQKLRDKKMFEAQLAAQQQQTNSMKVADELAKLKLQQEEQRRSELRTMLGNLIGTGGAGTSGVAAKNWQEQLVDIGGQKFPMKVQSSESMLPQLIQSLGSLMG